MQVKMEDVDIGYGGKAIVRGADFTLEGPGLNCIIGPNGVGKSTLVKCIDGLLPPMKGKVSIDGADLSSLSRKDISAKIAYVPVQAEDLFSMTVFDTVMIGRSNKYRWRARAEDIAKVKTVLEVLGIGDLAQCRFNELSAGQRELVAIARGLVQETEIIILDEPTANLDLGHQLFVTSLLHEIAKRKRVMVVMISHNVNIASMFADSILLMAPPGTVKKVGTVGDVIEERTIYDTYRVRSTVITHEERPVILLNRRLEP